MGKRIAEKRGDLKLEKYVPPGPRKTKTDAGTDNCGVNVRGSTSSSWRISFSSFTFRAASPSASIGPS